jgi:RNA polymerase sigma factor (sigma-70 family)
VQDCLKAYGGLVWALSKEMLSNQNDAEDAVQDIFIDVWKNAGRFDEKQSSETTFIAMLARRRLIDRLRKSNRQLNVDSLKTLSSSLQTHRFRYFTLQSKPKKRQKQSEICAPNSSRFCIFQSVRAYLTRKLQI